MANLPKPTNQDRKRATAQHIKPLAYGSYIDTRTGVFEAEGKKEILPGNLPIKNILASDDFSQMEAAWLSVDNSRTLKDTPNRRPSLDR